jgi:hypothetical protein
MNRVRVRGWWFVALLTLGVMVVPWPAWMIETLYSRGFYPRWQAVVTRTSNVSSLAIVDYLLIGVAIYVVWLVVRFIRRVRERSLLSAAWELARRLVRTSALLALIFLVSWGLNYQRRPLEETLRGGAPAIVTTDDIRALAERSIAGTHVTRPADSQVDREYPSVAARLADPFQRALRQLGIANQPTLGRPKVSLILTPFYTKAGVTGMVNPYALETIVHPGLLPFERPMTLAHEWAHLAGFADEADASAVGWLACTLGDPDLAYSAHLSVVLEAASAMPGSVWKDLRPKLDAGVLEDIAALQKRLLKQEPVVRDTAFKIYDHYLKSNGVSDGVRSYSRMLRVLVAMRATRP